MEIETKDLKSFCIFVCCGQSGHTILATILDAHPDAMIAEECGLIKKATRRGWSKERIFNKVRESSAQQAVKDLGLHNLWGSSRFKLGHLSQYQGESKDPVLLGDKMGWDAIELILDHDRPKNIFRFQNKVEVPVRIIHAIRDPFDIIASWYTGGRRYEKYRQDPKGLDRLVDKYITLTEAANTICYEIGFPPDQILRVRNEDLIADPVKMITTMYKFFELKIDPELVNEVASKVFKKPRKKSKSIEWPANIISRVNEEIISKYSFLEKYRW